MRWDRNYSSSEIEDRRGEGGYGVYDGGGGGGGLFLIIRLLSVFGWKGIVVGLLIAGAVALGGQCTNFASQGHHAAQPHGPVASSPEEDELVHFVGFVFDDVQRSWKAQFPDYQDAHLVLFRRAIRSACGTASTAVGP